MRTGFLSYTYLSLCSPEIYRRYRRNSTRHFGSGIVILATDLGEDVLGEDRRGYRHVLQVYSAREIEKDEFLKLFPDVAGEWEKLESARVRV